MNLTLSKFEFFFKFLQFLQFRQSNTLARDMQKRSEHLERINSDLKSKLDEVSGLYDASQRDNRNKSTEIVRLSHELDKTRETKDQLTRENKKLTGNYQFSNTSTQIIHSFNLTLTKEAYVEINSLKSYFLNGLLFS